MSERPEKYSGLTGIVTGLFILALTVLLTVVTTAGDERASTSSDWPTVTGVVTTSQHRRDRRPDHESPVDEYETVLDWEYTYAVDGTTYTSRRYGWGDRDERSSHGRGSEVTVYYDPSDPSTAVLNADSESTVSVGGILFGLVVGG